MYICVRLLRYARNGIEPVTVLLVVVVLRRFGIGGTAPLWVNAIPLLAGAVYQQPEVQRRLAGGDLNRRLWPRLAVHMLLVSCTMYLLGWGPLLAIAHLHILSMHLAWSGSRAWRPATVASVGSIGLGQLAVALGVVHSYVAQPEIHGVAALVAVGTAATGRVLGGSVERRERAEETLRTREQQFRVLVQDSSDVIAIVSADGNTTYVSAAALRVFGVPPDQLLDFELWKRIHPDDIGITQELHHRVLTSDAHTEQRGEFRIRNAAGEWRWIEVSSRNLLTDPAVRGVVGHYRDITERRAAQEKVEHAASHDALTGLVNSQTFMRRLEDALVHGGRVGLLFLDLDGFKQVNDTLGHEVGDELLVHVGRVVRRTTMASDVVGRLGGDEFGVVLTRIGGREDALAVAQRITAAIDREIVVAGHEVRVGCSIGVALSGPEVTQAKVLLREADLAMYEMKRANQRSSDRLARQATR